MDILRLLKPSENGVLVIIKNTVSECCFVEINTPTLKGKFVDLTKSKDAWLGRARVLFEVVKDEFANKSLTLDEIYSYFTLAHIEDVGIIKYLRTVESEFNIAYESITNLNSEDEKHYEIISALSLASMSNQDYRRYLEILPAYGLVNGSAIDTEINNCITKMVDKLKKINITRYDYDFIKKRLDVNFPYMKNKELPSREHAFIEMSLVKEFKSAFSV